MPVPCRIALPLRVLLASSMVWVGGCTLIGQKTFNRHAGDPPQVVIPPPPPVEVRHVPPLIEIRAGTPQPQWQPDLKKAVAEALARKPNVLFTIVAAIPDALSPDAQAALLSRIVATDAQAVAADVVHDGADPAQMEMTGMTDPGVDVPTIRIYVR